MTGIRTDMLDFPTAWAIQNRGGLTHHPRCSSVPGWHLLSGPGLLCDCDAVPDAWKLAVERARILTAIVGRREDSDKVAAPKLQRTYGPGITYFKCEYQMLSVLAGGGHSTLMLGGAIGLSHTSPAFKSAHAYLNRHGYIDYVRSAWRLLPKGQAYLDKHPMELP